MKQTVYFQDFVDAFRRFDRYNAFGYEGLRIIFDYLQDYEDSSGEEIELDVIAICCDYNMMHYADIARDYQINLDGLDEEAEQKQAVMDYLCDNTTVLDSTDDGCQIVFAVF